MRADTVTLKDGRTLEGKVVRRDDDNLVFDMQRGSATMRMNIEAAKIESVHEAPLAAAPTASAAALAETAIPEPPAPPVVAYQSPTYYRIPLRGVVGKTFSASYLSRALEDARLRKPTVVVLEIDSPGGLVSEVDKLVRVIAAAKRDLKIVALVRQAISAAAITTLSVDDIYVSKGSVFGAATAYEMDSSGMTRDVSEKMKSIWMSMARSSAELGGHAPVLADAMIDRNVTVYVREAGDHKTLLATSEAGTRVYKAPGRLLTLTATEAISCGLASALADDYAQLGRQLKLEGWCECVGLAVPLAEYRAQRLAAAEKQLVIVGERIEAQFQIASANNPAIFKDYMAYSTNHRLTPDSLRKWYERSQKCVAALAKVDKDLSEMEKLQADYPELGLEADILTMQKERIKAIKTVVQSGPPM